MKPKSFVSFLFISSLLCLVLLLLYGCGQNPTGGGKHTPVLYKLTVTTTPEGKGTVEAIPAGWNYTSGTTVELIASTLESGYVFGSWEGDVTGMTNPKYTTMDSNKCVTAVFREITPNIYTLTSMVSPDGSAGEVSLSPPGGSYIDGTHVTLTASAAAGYVFDGWVSDLGGSSNPATIEVNGDKIVTAVFKHLYSLTVSVTPTGAGTVEPWGGGIYKEGTNIVLTAEAYDKYAFSSWEGDLNGDTDNPVIVSMNSDKNVVAGFRARSWYVETIDTGGKWGVSIAVTTDNKPCISYYDHINQDLKYAKWTGSTWEIETVDSSSDNLGQRSSLTLDDSNNPHISYYDYENTRLKYAKWNGSSWDIEVVDDASATVDESSIALNSSSNYPLISYFYYHGGPLTLQLRMAKWTGTTWEVEVVDNSGHAVNATSIALDSFNNPLISYCLSTLDVLRLAKWTGTTWEIETVDNDGRVGEKCSLVLDTSDYPHIAYWDATNKKLKYARWTGSTWSFDNIADMGQFIHDCSLKLDKSGNPCISYGYSILPYYELRFAKWTGSDWEIETVEGSAEVGEYNSLAIDGDNVPHIGYYDSANETLKHAYYK